MNRWCLACCSGQRLLHHRLGKQRFSHMHAPTYTDEYCRDRIRSMAVPPRKSPPGTPYTLGLTGSIAMGKTTVSSMFQDLGIPVMDSDAVVHSLYEKGGAGVTVVHELFPDAVTEGTVDRAVLSRHVIGPGNESNMKLLETAIHPLVSNARESFLSECSEQGSAVAVLDVPLLFEKALETSVDAVVVVSAPSEVQRKRALARPGMTEDKLEAILARQTPDAEKRKRADFVLKTDKDTNFTRIEVAELVHQVLAVAAPQ